MIPKRLLIHECTATRPGEIDRDGNEGESTLYSLTACRLDVTKGYTITEPGYTKTDALTLFYDAINSKSEPEGYEPRELDRLTWQGHEYTITSVKVLYTQGTAGAHHYEAALL